MERDSTTTRESNENNTNQTIEETIEKVLASLNHEEKQTLAELQQLHGKLRGLMIEYTHEWNKLKLSYEKKFKPLYEQRCTRLCQIQNNCPTDQITGTHALPGFWHRCLHNNKLIAMLFEPHDEPILQYLTNVSSEHIDNDILKGFRLIFTFAKNPFFQQTELIKTYNMTTTETELDPLLASIESTAITWYHGKDVTRKVVKRKQRNKHTQQSRWVSTTVETDSFFNFFQSRIVPSEDVLDDMEDEDIQDLEEALDADYDIGSQIKDRIIPEAITYYLGVAKQEFSDSEFDSGSEGEVEEAEEEEEEEEVPRRRCILGKNRAVSHKKHSKI